MPQRIYQMLVLNDGEESGVTIEVALAEAMPGSNPEQVRERAEATGELQEIVIFRPDQLRQILGLIVWPFAAPPSDDISLPRFIEYLAYEPIVPIEESPLKGESLFKLAGMATGTGGYLGLVHLAQGADINPFVWLGLPTVLILLGSIPRTFPHAVQAVDDIGAEAVRYHLPRLLRLPRPPERHGR